MANRPNGTRTFIFNDGRPSVTITIDSIGRDVRHVTREVADRAAQTRQPGAQRQELVREPVYSALKQ